MTERENVIQKLEEVIAEAVYPDRPRKFMMPLELAEDALALLRSEASVDAVPVVRCRDCEHFIDMSGTSYPSYCYKHSTFDEDGEFDNAFSVEPDKYCSWGERRDRE